MSRPAATRTTERTGADPRFRFPHTSEPTRCRLIPQAFDCANGDRTDEAAERRLELARKECARCPVAAGCLLWALVNESAARVGIWAATTPRERTQLRKRIADRLGPDWVELLAAQGQARRERAAEARTAPLTIDQARIVRLDSDVNGPMPRPRTLSPARQQRNRNRLAAGVRSSRPAKTLAEVS
ncbi:WhiB family transcriptional regulator [Streptomyces populi]|uniref:WhiB family transcriptional regulator n=1 Tax=Streptomyces populi TaxID=2058924 RepID=UPI0035DA2F00